MIPAGIPTSVDQRDHHAYRHHHDKDQATQRFFHGFWASTATTDSVVLGKK